MGLDDDISEFPVVSRLQHGLQDIGFGTLDIEFQYVDLLSQAVEELKQVDDIDCNQIPASMDISCEQRGGDGTADTFFADSGNAMQRELRFFDPDGFGMDDHIFSVCVTTLQNCAGRGIGFEGVNREAFIKEQFGYVADIRPAIDHQAVIRQAADKVPKAPKHLIARTLAFSV